MAWFKKEKPCNCVDCCAAGVLLDLAKQLGHPPGKIVEAGDMEPDELALADVAFRLRNQPGVAFKALFEGLDHEAIVRELH